MFLVGAPRCPRRLSKPLINLVFLIGAPRCPRCLSKPLIKPCVLDRSLELSVAPIKNLYKSLIATSALPEVPMERSAMVLRYAYGSLRNSKGIAMTEGDTRGKPRGNTRENTRGKSGFL